MSGHRGIPDSVRALPLSEDRAVVNGAASVSAVPASVPSANYWRDRHFQELVPVDACPSAAFDIAWEAASSFAANEIEQRFWSIVDHDGFASVPSDMWDALERIARAARNRDMWGAHRHAYAPHRKYPWFCDLCGYPEHETLKHSPAQAMSAGTAETGTGSGRKPASAVGPADAPTLPTQGDHHG